MKKGIANWPLQIANCKFGKHTGSRSRSERLFRFAVCSFEFSICNSPLSARRLGLTLFEVLLSLAIFVGSMAALGQLIANGVRGAVQARLQTQAVLRCESKMAELVAGAQAFQAVAGASFLDDPSWSWSVTLGSGPHVDLYAVEVTVSHTGTNGLGDVSFSLQRLLRDPQIFVDAATAAAEESGT